MTDPETERLLQRLTDRDAELTRQLREDRDAARLRDAVTRRVLASRGLALAVLVLTAVPWLDYSQKEYAQGDWYTALGLVGRGSAVVENRLQPTAVVVLVLAVVVALTVPAGLRFSWVSGAVAVVSVVVVLSTKHADTDYSFYSWSPAAALCLCLAIALLVVQVVPSVARDR